MHRIFIPLLIFCAPNLSAQAIFWNTTCFDQNFCTNANSCTQGNATMSVSAGGGCSLLEYLWRLDLSNNGSIDQQGFTGTCTGTFPVGTHKISWRVNDGCGHILQCSNLFTIKDCQGPNMLCLNGLTQTLDEPECEATFGVNLFLLSVIDNCTPANQIEIGIRESGSGTGFPTGQSVTFDECDEGTNFVEVWARDANGLTNSCQSYVLVQTAGTNCVCNPDADITFRGCVRQPDGDRIADYKLFAHAHSTAGAQPPVVKNQTFPVQDSCFEVKLGGLPFGADYEASLRVDRLGPQANGVSTFDLLNISKHVLNVQPFTSMYQFVAADANNSQTITTFDILEYRKLILGLYDTLPNNKNWRFIKPLADPSVINWAAVKDKYEFVFPNVSTDLLRGNLHFIAIKTGDLNYNSTLEGPAAEDRSGSPLLLSLLSPKLQAGMETSLALTLPEKTTLEALQMAFRWDEMDMELLAIEPGPNSPIQASDFSLLPGGELRLSWFDAGGRPFEKGEILFYLKIKALNAVHLPDVLFLEETNLRSEAVLKGEKAPRQLALGFSEPASGASGPLFFPPVPNPFREKTVLRALLPEAGLLRLRVFDSMGRAILEKSSVLEAGLQEMEILSSDLPSRGVFFVRLEHRGGVSTPKTCAALIKRAGLLCKKPARSVDCKDCTVGKK